MDICVDFDGTCVDHRYPEVGSEIGAAPVLKRLTDHGHRLIIFTMRSGQQLADAYAWFREHNIPVYGVQTNPTQIMWTQSPKAYGQMYIDDAALGIPLKQGKVEKFRGMPDMGQIKAPRPYVDWKKVEKLLEEKALFNEKDNTN